MPYTSSQNFFVKYWWAFLFVLAIIGIAVITASLAEARELPLTIISAMLGVAMTVFATFFLFKGQGTQQVETRRNAKIFESKLESYNKFLKALGEYVKDPSNETGKRELKFQTAAIVMHAHPGQVAETVDHVGRIIAMYGMETDDSKLPEELFAIARCLRKELYPDSEREDEKFASMLNEAARKLAENISEGSIDQEQPAVGDMEAEAAAEEAEITSTTAARVPSWEAETARLEARGWDVSCADDRIVITRRNAPGKVEFFLRQGWYVASASLAPDNNDFSKALKNKEKGARSYGNWWRNLTTLRTYVRNGELLERLHDNDKVRAVILKWTGRLTDFIETYPR